jgi:hypothetical protein
MPDADLQLPSFETEKQHSISGLSSGAFMTVQLHLAHSACFVGAGVVAGGPYRCAESFRGAAPDAEDAFSLGALYICMTPLTPRTAPSALRLAGLARDTASANLIDPLENLADDRLYIFTGSEDKVVDSSVVKTTLEFYRLLGVPEKNIRFINDVPAGHSIITDNVTDSPLATNQPPYINYGRFWQSHDILEHIYGDLNPPASMLSGRFIRFEQRGFIGDETAYASMAPYGYAYIPGPVARGEVKARGVHIAMHGCKQGYSYVNYVLGKPDIANQPPYGARYINSTGYNEIAETNRLIILYPQATGDDDNEAQNPDGCWDWWGYSAKNQKNPDYYSKNAVQIAAIHRMLKRLGG